MVSIVGLDPGIKGGWAKVTEDGLVIDYGPLPLINVGNYKIPDIKSLMLDWADSVLIVVEEQHAVPGSPAVSLAQQCTGFGALLGQLISHPYGFNVEVVRPSQWAGDLVRAGFAEAKARTGEKVTASAVFRRVTGLLKCHHDGILDAAGVACWKAWSVNGELRRRRLEIARAQGLQSLGDSWVMGGGEED